MASKFTVPYAPSSIYRANNSIAELMLRAGAMNAEGARRSGEIWGSTIANLGQQVGGAVADWQAQKQEKKAQSARAAAIDKMLANGVPDLKSAVRVLGPVEGVNFYKGVKALDPTTPYKDQDAALRDMARGINALPPEKRPAAFAYAREQLIRQKRLDASQVPEQYNQDIIDYAANLGMEPQKPVVVKDALVDPASGKALYTAPQEPPKPPTSIDAAIVAADQKGNVVEVKRLLDLKRRASAATEAPKEADAAPVLTGPAMDIAAKMYLQTGTLPPMGMGKEGAKVRQAIINRAAEIDPEANIAASKAGYGADSSTLSKLRQQRAAIGAFEETAKKNIDIFLETAGKVVDTGSPMANTLLRQATGKMLGSKDQAAYDAARQVAINEVAKITSNPTLAGQLSDTARKEVEAFNPAGATLAQTVEVMRLLKRDMGNRIKSLDDEIGTVEDRLRGKKPEAAADGVEEWIRDPVTGKLRKK